MEHTIDATGKSLGRVATEAASVLLAKNTTTVKKNVVANVTVRRKNAIARVRTTVAPKTVITVNGKPIEQYFGTPSLRAIVSSPLSREGFSGKYVISVHVKGGGIHSQAEAVRHGLSRILVEEAP